ncbi:repressor LexA [Candidatus Peregrinibacteria bacterium]|nr:MAG: repressor LexA [Candidatus Peregrinibacteria bacterium]
MLESLTSSQQKVFHYYETFIQANQRPPTYEEAGRGLDVSPSVVYNHVKNLEKKGYLKSSSKSEGRGVEIFGHTQGIPILGKIACGEPIEVFEEASEVISVPKGMLKGAGPFYGLYAEGFSMINAGISDKDILVIRKQNDVDDGDIGVVILGDDPTEERATLKRVYKKPQSIMLKPENADFESIAVENCQIRGKLIGRISYEEKPY